MSRKVTIALDAMSGDRGPDVVVAAAFATLDKDDSVTLNLVGLPETLEAARRSADGRYDGRLRFTPASEVVEMHEPPAEAVRRKKDSSLRVAIELVKSGEADACVAGAATTT